MIKNPYSALFILLFYLFSCNEKPNLASDLNRPESEKITTVEKLHDIESVVPHSAICRLYTMDNYLIVTDSRALNKGIHLYDKQTFKYITSTGIIGRGPGEITRYGLLIPQFDNKSFWMTDYGKAQRVEFPIDSLLANPDYQPSRAIEFSNDVTLLDFTFISDSTALGKCGIATSSSSFNEIMASQNFYTDREPSPFGYVHPSIKGQFSRLNVATSVENNVYVTGYKQADLLTICDLQGNLKYNIYGPDWGQNTDLSKSYYHNVEIAGDYIIASYSGQDRTRYNDVGRKEAILPTKLLVYNLNGEYIKTIDTEFQVVGFSVDEKRKRIIAFFLNRNPSLTYFNFDFS